MNIVIKLSSYTVSVWALLLMINLETIGQNYYEEKKGINSNISKTRFEFSNIKISIIGGVLHNRNIIYSPGPLVNTKPFSSSVSPNLIFILSYKHNSWLNPELIYRSINYYDADEYNYYGNYGSYWLFRANELGIGNRFYVINRLFVKNLKISFGLNALVSLIEGNFVQISGGKLKIFDSQTNDSLVFKTSYSQLSTSNFLLSMDLLLELQVFRYFDIGIGIAYFQGFNKTAQSTTEYKYNSINYLSDKFHYGSGIQPFLKLTIKLKE